MIQGERATAWWGQGARVSARARLTTGFPMEVSSKWMVYRFSSGKNR